MILSRSGKLSRSHWNRGGIGISIWKQKISRRASTGENIVRALWPKIDNRVNQQLVRPRLWETANNRFALRRT